MAAKLAEVNRALKKARQASEKAASQWVLTEPMRRATLAAYSLAGYVAEPAVIYLEECGRRHDWPHKGAEELSTMVEDLFTAVVDWDEFAALSDVEDPFDEEALKVALKYVGEWRIIEWVRTQNRTIGAGPSSQAMLDRLEEGYSSLPEHLRPRPVGTISQVGARVRAHRLRLRWRGRYVALPAGERPGPEETRRKVPIPPHRPGHKNRSLRGPWAGPLRGGAAFGT